MVSPSAQDLLGAGDPAGALRALQQEVRQNAADVKLRIFLFQLLAVMGQWKRALDQLEVCERLDAGTLAMVATYRPALHCEAVREAVFAGRTLPHAFGAPAPWLAALAQALQLDAEGHAAAAAALRAQALEDAPATPGTIDGRPFAWIADADTRLGPVLEVIIGGRYGWLPFAQVQQIAIEPAADLRDLVWAPAQLTLATGGGTIALLPVRYGGTVPGDDGALALARKTEWLPLGDAAAGVPAEHCRGLGQRVLTTDAEDAGLLDVRRIELQAT